MNFLDGALWYLNRYVTKLLYGDVGFVYACKLEYLCVFKYSTGMILYLSVVFFFVLKKDSYVACIGKKSCE